MAFWILWVLAIVIVLSDRKIIAEKQDKIEEQEEIILLQAKTESELTEENNLLKQKLGLLLEDK